MLQVEGRRARGSEDDGGGDVIIPDGDFVQWGSGAGDVFATADGTGVLLTRNGAAEWNMNTVPLVIGGTGNLRVNDLSAIQFGTPGTDIVLTSNGVGVDITGTGRIGVSADLRIEDGFFFTLGSIADVTLTPQGGGVVDIDGGLLRLLTTDLLVSDTQAIQLGSTDEVRLNGQGASGFASIGPGAGAGSGILLEDDFRLLIGDNINGWLEFDSGPNRIDLIGNLVNDSGANANTAVMRLQSGNRITNDALGSPASGAVTVGSGDTDITDGAGTGGFSGRLTLFTGGAFSAAGISGDSGILSILTGSSADGNTGNIEIAPGQPGPAGTPGTVELGAGQTATLGEAETPVQVVSRDSLIADGVDAGARVVMREDWYLFPVLNADLNADRNMSWELAGAGALGGQATSSTRGGMSIATGAALNNITVWRPHQTNVTGWAVGGQLGSEGAAVLRCWHQEGSSQVVRVEIGARATPTAMDDTTDADKILVRFDSSDGVTSAVNYVLVTTANSVDTLTDTGIPYNQAANAIVRFVFSIHPTTRAVSLFMAVNDAPLRLVNDPNVHVLDPASGLGDVYGGVKNLDGNAHTDYVFGPVVTAKNAFA